MGICNRELPRCKATGSISDSGGEVAEKWLSEFNPQNVADTAWAFATVNYRDEKLLAALARVLEQQLNEFNLQAVANTAWAVADGIGVHNSKPSGRRASCLCLAMAKAAEWRFRGFQPQELASMAWAFATVDNQDQHQTSTRGKEQVNSNPSLAGMRTHILQVPDDPGNGGMEG
jgi:hypothetical protein